MNWTSEMDAAIASYLRDGISAQLIAENLGITRNAVLGRTFRLGLCQTKEAPRRPSVTVHATRPPKPRPPPGKRRDGITPLGRAARACGFTVEALEEIRRDIEEDML